MAPHACHPGKRILHPGKINLKPGFLGARPLCKNIQDHLFSIDHGEVRKPFPITLLHRAQFIIKNDTVTVASFREFYQFIGLPCSAEQASVSSAHAYELHPDHSDPERVDKFLEFKK